MRRVLITALPAFLVGAVAAAVVIDRGWAPLPAGVARIIDEVPAVSLAEAESHRQAHYADLRSIEDVLALPGDFARREALYVLAGRSDSAAVQDLIFQAGGIGQAGDRTAFLQVLFSRLAELDPPSALALARTRDFRAEPALEASAWQSWGRLDLEAALRAAVDLGDAPRRDLAAQALLAAHGYRGNDRTDRIVEVLGIGLSRETQAAWLQRLAAHDPAGAFTHLGTLERAAQQQAAAALGEFLGRAGLDAAMHHAGRLTDKALRQAFIVAAAKASAHLDPGAALDVLLSGSLADSVFGYPAESLAAMRQIVAQELDGALAYFEQVDNPRQRNHLGGTIVSTLAQSDPEQALAWARSNERDMHGSLYARALASIAIDNPELAIDEALGISDRMQRQSALSWVGMSLGRNDPRRAVQMLERVDDRRESEQLAQTVTQNWLQTDPDAALEWLLGLDEAKGRQLLMVAGQMLPQTDPEAAMRWLPRLDEQTASAWRLGIASSLAMQRSAAEAERFVARFEGTADYPHLQMAAITGVARTDIEAALRMARQLPPGPERSNTYSNLAMRLATQDPRRATELLSAIEDEDARAGATGMVARQWAGADPAAAQRWVENLPPGEGRDNAIAQLASEWDEMTPSRQRLLESVDSPELRKQALISQAWRVARTDVQKAERLIRSIDMSDEEKQQMLEMIANTRRHSVIGDWGIQR